MMIVIEMSVILYLLIEETEYQGSSTAGPINYSIKILNSFYG